MYILLINAMLDCLILFNFLKSFAYGCHNKKLDSLPVKGSV